MSFDYKKITGYEAACADQKRDPARLPDVSKLEPGLGRSAVAFVMLCVINVSLNKDEKGNPTKANWADISEEKWSAWQKVIADKKHPSGSGLSFYGAGCVDSCTRVASRLTCREAAIAEYFYGSENFKSLWEDYLLHRED